MQELTERQREILEFIRSCQKENGYPPTLREIGKHFAISSTFGVKRHLDALEKKGYLQVTGKTSRGLSIPQEAETEQNFLEEYKPDSVAIPILGRVAAGSPISAVEQFEGMLTIDASFIKHAAQTFALRIKGDSMINAGMFEGDLVVVDKTTVIHNWDIVVAMIDGEATVKRFASRNGYVVLMPENEKYLPIEITNKENVTILGKVIALYRKF